MYSQLFLLFAMIFTGYFLRRLDLINSGMNEGVSKVIVYVAYPCLIVYNVGTMKLTSSLFRDFAQVALIGVGFFALYGLISQGWVRLTKQPEKLRDITALAIALPNNGFMGFPVALIFLGPKGLLLMTAHTVAFNIYTYTYGVYSLDRHKREKDYGGGNLTTVLKLLMNPNLLAIITGFILCLGKVPLNNPVGEYLTQIGKISTPMAMIYIGSVLAEGSVVETFTDSRIIRGSVIKLIGMPVITAAVVWFLPISVEVKAILILGSAFPSAAIPVMLVADRLEEAGIAGQMLFFSTVVSGVTLPIAMKLLQWGLSL